MSFLELYLITTVLPGFGGMLMLLAIVLGFAIILSIVVLAALEDLSPESDYFKSLKKIILCFFAVLFINIFIPSEKNLSKW